VAAIHEVPLVRTTHFDVGYTSGPFTVAAQGDTGGVGGGMARVRRLSPPWRGLAPGLATGGALLTGSPFWLYVTVGPDPTEGPMWQLAVGVAMLATVVTVALAQSDAGPTSGAETRVRRLPWVAASACLVGMVVAGWRLPAQAVGPDWPAALVGFAVSAGGFALLAVRARASGSGRPAGGAHRERSWRSS
jgi:hypothetical protein